MIHPFDLNEYAFFDDVIDSEPCVYPDSLVQDRQLYLVIELQSKCPKLQLRQAS